MILHEYDLLIPEDAPSFSFPCFLSLFRSFATANSTLNDGGLFLWFIF